MSLPPQGSSGSRIQPFTAIAEAGATELIDKDDAEVAQNEFGKSVAVSLGGTYSGEILSWIVVQTELGSGAILSDLAGELWVFDADPGISAGDADITAAEAQTLIGVIAVSNSNLIAEGVAGVVFIPDKPMPFHALATLYIAFRSSGSTAINSSAGDDEEVHLNFWYRRDS